MKKLAAIVSFLIFLTLGACAKQPILIATSTPELDVNSSSVGNGLDKNIVKLTRHIILGYGRGVWEVEGDEFVVFFEGGTIDGYVILTETAECQLFEFSIYDLEKTDGRTNLFTINGIHFERLKNYQNVGPPENLHFPIGYDKTAAVRIFELADFILAAFNKTEEEIRHVKMPYNFHEHINPSGPYDVFYARLLKKREKCTREVTFIDELSVKKVLQRAIIELR